MVHPNHTPWISFERIADYVQIEPALVIVGLTVGVWLISKIFFKDLSESRKETLSQLFKNLFYHLVLGIILFITFYAMQHFSDERPRLERVMVYVGFGTLLSGATVFVKVWRILVFEYFFISHMKVAFPVLLVNLFTLLLSLAFAVWFGTEIFGLQLTPILATSAILSLILGLAVQDTLGNLFAGVALQFDKSYEIGDWIEVQSSGQKWVGRVSEISWRATILIAISEELITIPNRVMSQAQLANFSCRGSPIIRTQIFRLSFGSDLRLAKEILLRVANSTTQIRHVPKPIVYIFDSSESWIALKLIYYIDDYGDQFEAADVLYSKSLVELKMAGFEFPGHKVMLTTPT